MEPSSIRPSPRNAGVRTPSEDARRETSASCSTLRRSDEKGRSSPTFSSRTARYMRKSRSALRSSELTTFTKPDATVAEIREVGGRAAGVDVGGPQPADREPCVLESRTHAGGGRPPIAHAEREEHHQADRPPGGQRGHQVDRQPGARNDAPEGHDAQRAPSPPTPAPGHRGGDDGHRGGDAGQVRRARVRRAGDPAARLLGRVERGRADAVGLTLDAVHHQVGHDTGEQSEEQRPPAPQHGQGERRGDRDDDRHELDETDEEAPQHVGQPVEQREDGALQIAERTSGGERHEQADGDERQGEHQPQQVARRAHIVDLAVGEVRRHHLIRRDHRHVSQTSATSWWPPSPYRTIARHVPCYRRYRTGSHARRPRTHAPRQRTR